MSKGTTVLGNSLILLVLGLSAPAVWAADAAPPAAAGDNSSQVMPAPPRPRVLDLKVPELHQVMSAEQIAAAIPNPDDLEVIGPETVQVRGATPPPYVPSGFAALYWAAVHPMSAWRIFTPVQ